ncbi:hypothetical protein [Croceicoccus sp. Ery15]|uniref:hypothetical protein n=1 Tax=Croceicoccus sp. Ery15 TaxID=1703338 RepID=UPI001E2F0A4D|nr:hypothetical protein [Croceicoccus sp. Ery15]
MSKNPRLIDMTGKKYGRWTIICQAGNNSRGAALWSARCDCGTERTVLGADLRKSKSVSCGCYRDEKIAMVGRTHGRTRDCARQKRPRLYNIWVMMRSRCLTSSNAGYARYGGRGIIICPEWSDFATFERWALDNGYRDDLTIDRIDNDGNYDPSNCRWADAKTQSRNRNFVRRMPDGRMAMDVAEENGIPVRTMRVRLSAGWPLELAVSHPYGQDRKKRNRDSLGRFD